MPYINLKTNVEITDPDQLVKDLGELIRIIPKKTPERTMIQVEGNRTLYFASSSEPCVMIETWVNNATDMSTVDEYCQKVLLYIAETLKVDKKRIYVTVDPLTMWYAHRD